MSKISNIVILVFIGIGLSVFSLSVRDLQGAVRKEPPVFVKEAPDIKTPRPFYVPDEIIVKFKPQISVSAAKDLLRKEGVIERYENKRGGFNVLKVKKGNDVVKLAEKLKRSPLVEYAELNYYAYTSMVPNDPAYPAQWHFDNPTYGGIQMEQAWDMSTGASSVIVAIVDTGVAYEDYPAPAHWHIDSYNAYGGSGNSWWCGLDNPDWVNPPGYGNGWKDYLQHSFDLTTATGNITFFYKYKYDMESNYDFGYTEISTNGGLTWVSLRSYTGKTIGVENGWKSENINLTSYAGSNILLRFRFNSDETCSDEDGGDYIPPCYGDSDGAWYIDEIKLQDGSGVLFFDDAGSGQGSWETTQYKRAPDLAGTNFVQGYDFINNDTHPNDDDGHGTHVAGTIAQTTNNSLGTAGIAFNASVMPVKVLDAAGSGTYDQVAAGIYYAVDNGAKIINMSLGGGSPAAVLENAVTYAYNNGVTVIAACGNSNTSSCSYPAAYNNYVIAVGATQYDETKAYYSSYGSSLDVVAPGGNIYDGGGVLQQTFGDTPVDFGLWSYQGTSMATPHVAGVAALLKSKKSDLTPDQIRNILQTTAEDKGDVGWDSYYGYGLIDAYAALSSVPAVSITLTTDGSVDFGTAPLGTTRDNLGDAQIVRVDAGPADLNIKSTVFSNGTSSWALGGSNGDNQVVWEYSKEGTTWNKFLAAGASYPLATDVSELGTQNFYLRLTLPTATAVFTPYNSAVTIMATQP